MEEDAIANTGTFSMEEATCNSVADVLNVSKQSLVASVDYASDSPPAMAPMLLGLVTKLKLHLQRHCIAKTSGSNSAERHDQLEYLSLTGLESCIQRGV